MEIKDYLERISPHNLTLRHRIFIKMMRAVINSESEHPIPDALYFETSISQVKGSILLDARGERLCRRI